MNLPSLITRSSRNFSQCYLRRIEPIGRYQQLYQFSSTAKLSQSEEPGPSLLSAVTREEGSDPNLFHRQVNVRLRLGNKRAVRDIRKEGTWYVSKQLPHSISTTINRDSQI